MESFFQVYRRGIPLDDAISDAKHDHIVEVLKVGSVQIFYNFTIDKYMLLSGEIVCFNGVERKLGINVASMAEKNMKGIYQNLKDRKSLFLFNL